MVTVHGEGMWETGSKQTFLKLKGAYPQVCLVHLYALEGAVRNVEFNCLPEDTKKIRHLLIQKRGAFFRLDKGGFPTSLCVIYRKGKYLSSPMETFIQLVKMHTERGTWISV